MSIPANPAASNHAQGFAMDLTAEQADELRRLKAETMAGQMQALGDQLRVVGQAFVEAFRPVVAWWNNLPAYLRELAAARAKLPTAHQQALAWLDEALDETEAELAAQLAECRQELADVWGWALHHRLWAACELGLTEADVMARAADILRYRHACNWTTDQAAEIAAAVLEGWASRLAFRELHPGAV